MEETEQKEQTKKEVSEKLYRTMVKIRFFEESLAGPILRGEIKTPCHLYSGQEAVAVGVCSNLRKEDYVFGNHRSHGHYLAKGGDIKELRDELYCRETGCSGGRGGSMHIISKENSFLGSSPIVGGTISLATGVALANKIKGNDLVSISFFGDGATGEGVLYESMNLASLKKLAVIFVCENNLYSTHMSIKECRPPESIYKIAEPFGIKTCQIDGNNVLEVFEKTKEAVDFCRKGKGPVFLECLTYRHKGHVGPDDNVEGSHIDIRPRQEVELWLKKDPIKRFENYLLENNIFNQQELEEIKDEIKRQ